MRLFSRWFGVVALSLFVSAIHAMDYYVSLTGSHNPPFSTWADAATNIQDAVDAASVGDTVWVTNGIYATGGKVMVGDLTNRVAVDKALTVQSVNGSSATIIEGLWDPMNTNGPLAMRTVWLGSNAELRGFTIRRGATRAGGDTADQNGGGIWCLSSQSLIENCVVSNNAAYANGGGVWGGKVNNSKLLMNQVGPSSPANGGGAAQSALVNCYVAGNYCRYQGGGLYDGSAVNCTIVYNFAMGSGGGIAYSKVTNTIIYHNSMIEPGNTTFGSRNYYPPSLIPDYSLRCCTTPVVIGPVNVGSFSSDPQLLDSYHIAVTSPCRGAGTNLASGTDLDGEPWSSPPSVGCDEYVEVNITGSLELSISSSLPFIAERGFATMTGNLNGRASRVAWDYGDGVVLTNPSVFVTGHVWQNPGDYNVVFTAYNADYPDGVSTNLKLPVISLVSPQIVNPSSGSNSFTLSFQGQPGVRYYVEQATNLAPPVVWSTVQSPRSTGQVMQVTDTSATNDMRFYRVRIP